MKRKTKNLNILTYLKKFDVDDECLNYKKFAFLFSDFHTDYIYVFTKKLILM